jgi:hypothetical protein
MTTAFVMTLYAATGRVQAPPAFQEVMRRVHEYVVLYEDHELSTVLSEERYEQRVVDASGCTTQQRTLLSDFLMFQLPPDEDWFALRDVYELDGEPVSDRTVRLQELFTGPAEGIVNRAMAISKESARFNIGDVYRTINVPTFPLRFLRPASRSRFEYSKAGEERVDDKPTWVIAYRETGRPTFVATPERRDVPATGRFWVAPDTGVVLRSEMVTGGTRDVPARAVITVLYREDPSLGFRVPVEMNERYDRPRDKRASVITGVATYSRFRPFNWRSLLPPRNF